MNLDLHDTRPEADSIARPWPDPEHAMRVTLRAGRGCRLFSDELDFAMAGRLIRAACGRHDPRLRAWCLLPDRCLMVLDGPHDALVVHAAGIAAGLRAAFGARHRRLPPSLSIEFKRLGTPRAIRAACMELRRLPVVRRLAPSPEAWGWLGGDPGAVS